MVQRIIKQEKTMEHCTDTTLSSNGNSIKLWIGKMLWMQYEIRIKRKMSNGTTTNANEPLFVNHLASRDWINSIWISIRFCVCICRFVSLIKRKYSSEECGINSIGEKRGLCAFWICKSTLHMKNFQRK